MWVCLAEVLRSNNVRKRRNAIVFFNVFKNFLKYVFIFYHFMQRSKMIWSVAMPQKSRKRTKTFTIWRLCRWARKGNDLKFFLLGLEINSTSCVISVPAVDSFRLSAWRKVLSPAKNHWRTEGIFFMGIYTELLKERCGQAGEKTLRSG